MIKICEYYEFRRAFVLLDEIKRFIEPVCMIAQDTAERVKQAAHERSNNIIHQAEQDAQRLLEVKYKANEILRQATDNARKSLLKQKN